MDAGDNPLKDKDGNLTIPFKPELFQTVVVDVMPGVAKMFKVYDRNDTFVAATTTGMAALNDRAISAHASDFVTHQSGLKSEFANVNAVVAAFAKHVNKAYEQHYSSSRVNRDYWGDLDFLLGGYGKHDNMPCLFRLNIKQNMIKESFSCGQHGVAWAGQSDSVERVIRGYDSILRFSIEDRVNAEFDKYRGRMAGKLVDIVNAVLKDVGANIPEDIDLTLPGPPRADLEWESAHLTIPYGSLATQRAVDFVSFLVMLQSGPQRFSTGIATVGGRTHVGVVTQTGFELLNEPELDHSHTGFSDDS